MSVVKSILARALLVLAAVLAAFEVVGCSCLNSLMFFPVGTYGPDLAGYRDIGTNGVPVAAMTVGPEKGKRAYIYCHGNAEDMTQSMCMFERLAAQGMTVASVDYPGYGLSAGSPDEKGCYRNVHRLYDWLVAERGFRPEDIVVVGFSIGTGPATELAATEKVGALVLMAPFLSAPRVVTRIRILPVDPFPNLRHIKSVKCPVTVIHGTADEVIPFKDGRELFGLANEPKRFIAVEGSSHNGLASNLGLARLTRLLLEAAEGDSPSSSPPVPRPADAPAP